MTRYRFVAVDPAGDKENAPDGGSQPSAGWMKQPAWIDGGVDPPRFYHSHEEIATAHRAGLTGAFARRDTAPVLPAVSLPAVRHPSEPTGSGAAVGNRQNHELAVTDSLTGHLVSVTACFSSTEKAAGRAGRTVVKKNKNTKSDYVVIEGISRASFVTKLLAIHGLANDFAPGVHSGPVFKLWYSGSNGGKAGAASVETDRDFAVTVDALLRKNKRTCMVSAEIDVDTMEGFRIRTRAPISALQDPTQDEELLYGTRVPHVELFSDTAQLHGAIIIQLKQRWTCQQHLGEHGEPGYCYITPGGEHVGLNTRKLRIWASAIHAHEATKHTPPNSVEFDGARDGRLLTAKPRGRTGPASLTPTSSLDPTALLMAAVLPLITSLADRQPTTAPAPTSSPAAPSIGPQAGQKRPLSPAPDPNHELADCLQAFKVTKGIDFTAHEATLLSLDFTPDILADVPAARLREITGAAEGRVLKFQVFCRQWNARLEEKRAYRGE
ncbi:hypothetical protein FKP32DRAFT_1578952 [Trametes sanguinea]|nr:hypothetical protein FKP32DRAFT_1578952 [Trametes sanguinea]